MTDQLFKMLVEKRQNLVEMVAKGAHTPETLHQMNRFAGAIDVIDDFLSDDIKDFMSSEEEESDD